MPTRQPVAEQMTGDGAADAVRPSGDQSDGFRLRHVIRYLSRSTGRSGREPHSAQEPS